MSALPRKKDLNVYFTFHSVIKAIVTLGFFKKPAMHSKCVSLLMVLLLAVVEISIAQTPVKWLPSSGTHQWSVAGNWEGGVVPTSVNGLIPVFDQGNSICVLPACIFPCFPPGFMDIRGLVLSGPATGGSFSGTISLNGRILRVNPLASTEIVISSGTISGGTLSILGGSVAISVSGLTATSASFSATTTSTAAISTSTFGAGFSLSADDISLATVSFGGTTTITKTGTGPCTIDGAFTNTFTGATNVTIRNNGTGSFTYKNDTFNKPVILHNNAGGTFTFESATFNGNLTITRDAGTFNACYTADCRLAGNLLVNGTAGGIFSFGNDLASSGMMEFIGSSPQTINIGPGITSLSFTKISLNKTIVETVTANTDIQVTSQATMTNGILAMGNSTVTFNDPSPSSITGYSNSSFIDGWVKFIFAGGGVTFPTGIAVGKFYRPVTITFSEALANISARYFKSGTPSSGSVTSPITNVSTIEYWSVNAFPASNFTATLPWKNADVGNTGYVTDTDQLRVAHFTAASWQNKGGPTDGGSVTTSGLFTPLPLSGMITSNIINTGGGNIGNLTLGSTDAAANELSGQKCKWRGTSNNQWSNALNWLNNVVPSTNEIAIFDSGANPCVLPGTSVTVGAIELSGFTGNLDLNGQTLTVNSNGPSVLSSGNIIGTGTLDINGSANEITISGLSTLSTVTLDISGSNVKLTGNATIAKLVSSANLDLNGRSLTLNGNNVTSSFTGGSVTNSGIPNSIFITSMGSGGATISTTNFGSGVNLNANTTGTTSITVSGSATFDGSVTIQSPDLFLNGATFNEVCSFTKTSNTDNIWNGGNTFNKDVTITIQGTGSLTCSTTRDTYNKNITLIGESFSSAVFNTNLKLAGDLNIGRVTTSTSTFRMGTIEFIAGNSQTIRRVSGSFNFITLPGDMILNKTGAATVSIQTPAIIVWTVLGTTSFNNGIFVPEPSWGAFLDGPVTGGSKLSFVHGIVRRSPAGAFTFPVGDKDKGVYRPLTLSNAGGFHVSYRMAVPINPTAVAGPGVITNVSTCEYWNVDNQSLPPHPNTAITLGWVSSDCTNNPATYVTNLADLRVAYYDAGGTNRWQSVGNTGTTPPTTAGTVTSNSSNVFVNKDVTLGSVNATTNPLPIELSEFSAELTGEGVVLNWETQSETNNNLFEIERSSTGLDFVKIGEVPGHGTSQVVNTYSWIDHRPLLGRSYYRLRQVDYDENATYSEVISIFNNSSENKFSVYPVPLKGTTLFLSVRDDVKIFDQLGNVVFVDYGVSEINLEGFKPGIYCVKITSGEVCRFIVN